MKNYSLENTRLALHFFVTKINEGQSIAGFYGNECYPKSSLISTEKKLKPIKANVKATMEWILAIFHKNYGKTFARKDVAGKTYQELNIPPIFTNNKRFGKIRTLSPRATRDHFDILISHGLISEKVFHGTRADLELYINPLLLLPPDELFPKSKKTKKKTSQIAPNTPPDKRQILPPISGISSNNLKKINTTDGDKLSGAGSRRDVLPAGENLLETPQITGNPSRPANINFNRNPSQPVSTGIRQFFLKSSSTVKEKGNSASIAADQGIDLKSIYIEMTEKVFLYACKTIYKTKNFTPEEQRKAKIAIWNGVFGGFKMNWSLEKYTLLCKQVIVRHDLADRYYKDHPGTYAPKPFADKYSERGYYDREKKYGFEKTADWYEAHMAYKRKNKARNAISQAYHEIRGVLKPHLVTAKKLKNRIENKTPTELYRFHENKIRAFGGEYLKEFYRQQRNLSFITRTHF